MIPNSVSSCGGYGLHNLWVLRILQSHESTPKWHMVSSSVQPFYYNSCLWQAERPCYNGNSRPHLMLWICWCGIIKKRFSTTSRKAATLIICYLFLRVLAAFAVDSSHITLSLSTSWSWFSPPLDFNGHVSPMWFMVFCWPQSQEGVVAAWWDLFTLKRN